MKPPSKVGSGAESTMPTRKPRRPKPVHMGDVRARAKRAPKSSDPTRWYWQAVIRRDGKDVTVVSGWFTRKEISKELAKRVAEDDLDRPRETGTIAGLVDAWAEHAATVARTSKKTKAAQVHAGKRIVTHMGAVLVDRVRKDTIESFQTALLDANYSPATIRLTLVYLGQAWSYGRERGLVPDRSLPKVRPPVPRRVQNDYVPTASEARRVLEQLEEDNWQRRALELIHATGCRVNEVLQLTWDDFRLEGPRTNVTVRGKRTSRTDGVRIVALAPSTVEYLLAMREVQPSTNVPFHGYAKANDRTLLRNLKASCRKAGVPEFRTHALRALAMTQAMQAKIPPHVAAAHFGVTVPVMLTHYAQVDATDAAETAAAIGRAAPERGKLLPFRRKG